MFLIFLGEIIVRMFHLVSDIPKRVITNHGIQKYVPNQEGYWKGGHHKWMINDKGWPGELPLKFDNLILLIGDSFIENFMNPNNCHQAAFLKNYMPQNNFMEAGRSGVSLIEAMEICEELNHLKPLINTIYLNNNDFYESIVEIQELNDITQLELKNKKIIKGKLKSPGLKIILYNWKLAYYLYNRFSPATMQMNEKTESKNKDNIIAANTFKHQKEVFELIEYISSNYGITNKILIFHPDSDQNIINKCIAEGFKVIVLNTREGQGWTFDYDSHWTCYGHEQAAKQIAGQLPKIIEDIKNNSIND